MTSRNGDTVTWTSDNLPASLPGNGYTAQFDYAPDRSRWRQVSGYSSGNETTIYVGGLLEKLTTPVRTHWKHLISTPSGQVQHVRRSDGTTPTFFLPSDHLGSVDAVLYLTGTVLVRTSFYPLGQRRDDDWNGAPSAAEYQDIANSTRRGFTGHEMLDNVGLIHMNGRVYDPVIGRFMSADPFIDGFANPQGWNRYAYVKNRPLSAVDPTGFSDERGNVNWQNEDEIPEPPSDLTDPEFTVEVTAERISQDRPTITITGGTMVGGIDGHSGGGGGGGDNAKGDQPEGQPPPCDFSRRNNPDLQSNRKKGATVTGTAFGVAVFLAVVRMRVPALPPGVLEAEGFGAVLEGAAMEPFASASYLGGAAAIGGAGVGSLIGYQLTPPVMNCQI